MLAMRFSQVREVWARAGPFIPASADFTTGRAGCAGVWASPTALCPHRARAWKPPLDLPEGKKAFKGTMTQGLGPSTHSDLFQQDFGRDPPACTDGRRDGFQPLKSQTPAGGLQAPGVSRS